MKLGRLNHVRLAMRSIADLIADRREVKGAEPSRSVDSRA